MSVVLLVRHGQASFGLGNYDQLSGQGRQQAARLGEILRTRKIAVDRVVSGDLVRQRETAAIVSEQLGVAPASVDPRWDEYDHMPLIARVRPAYRKHWIMVADLARSGNPGRGFQDLMDTALERWVTDDEAPPEPPTAAALDAGAPEAVETFSAYRGRITAALQDATAVDGITVVVSSAGSIAAAVAPLLGIGPQGWSPLHRVMVNTSVTKVVRGPRGITLISFNDHGHLEGVPGVEITYR